MKIDPVVGRCMTKCPKKEVDFRIKNQLLHPLECEKPFEKIAPRLRRPIIERICKSYRRPAANQTIHLEEVRSISALKETVDYLLELENEFPSDSQFSLVYEYLSDRFRSVRQCIIVQQLKDERTSKIFEQMICFYIRSKFRAQRLKVKSYDATLHSRELDENLERWRHFETKSEEMRILHLLYSLNDPDIFGLLHCQQEFIDIKTYKLLWDLFSAYTIQNYVRFFRLISQFADTLRSQVLIKTIEQMRLHAFETIAASTKSPMCSIPVNVVCKWLAMDEEDFKTCVTECFEKSPLVEQNIKCHGCKLKSPDSAVLSFQWVLLSRSLSN